jgi:O-antigen/teichoic acid export membrane protein
MIFSIEDYYSKYVIPRNEESHHTLVNLYSMSGIKKLAKQTIWYGASTIAARFINYLLTPFLTYTLANTSDYGKMGLIYSAIPILNIIFTYGFETAYFRFAAKEEYKRTIYSTAALSLIFSTVLLTIVLWLNQGSLARITQLNEFPRIIQMSIFIIALDALTTIPFARLREQGRPRKFAFIKIAGILINVLFTWFFIAYCPNQVKHVDDTWVTVIYNDKLNPVYYIILANLIQSGITLLLLGRELKEINLRFDLGLWKKMMLYSMPLIIAGMAGMINETFDRLMLVWWLPGVKEAREQEVGIYNACYKLSILITLFIQAFRLGAEPFFFKQSEGSNPQRVYARVMKFFVIVVATMFLLVSLFLPVWKYFIGPKYWAGLSVVPILLWANIFLGIYYNLSIWYKLSHRTMAGAWITLAGAAITFAINYFLIPKYSYMACAWATFACYGTMMILSFVWGQAAYRIPYAWKKLLAYMVIAALVYFMHEAITGIWQGRMVDLTSAAILLLGFVLFVGMIEKKELPKLPVIGKYFA